MTPKLIQKRFRNWYINRSKNNAKIWQKLTKKTFQKKNKNTFPKNIFIKNFQFCSASNNHDHSSDVIQKCDKIISIFFLYKSEKTSCDTVYSTRFGKNWPSSSRILGGLDPFAAKTVVDVKRSTIPLQFRFAGEFVPLNTKSERWKKDSCFLASARKCDSALCFNVDLYGIVAPSKSIFGLILKHFLDQSYVSQTAKKILLAEFEFWFGGPNHDFHTST